MTTPARLTVLAGPTAVGKGTVSADIRERYPEVWLSVSATTRAPRPGEVDGVHYHFVSEGEFDRMVAESSKLTERMVKLAGEAAEPLQTRASLNAERVNTLVA